MYCHWRTRRRWLDTTFCEALPRDRELHKQRTSRKLDANEGNCLRSACVQ